MEHLTAPATIEFARKGVAVVRFRPKVILNTAVMAEVMHMRRAHASATCSAIVVIPEHTAYDADLLTMDHYVTNGLVHRTEALAIVCLELGLIPLLRLYFAYYTPPFPVHYCSSVEEANRWMRQRMGLGVVE